MSLKDEPTLQGSLSATYAAQAAGIPAWAASTAYTVGQVIRNPSGQPVTVTTAHTSTTYDSTKFSTPLGYMPYAGTQTITTIKPTGDGRPGVWELIHNDTAGYIFHLMCGSGMGSGQALIGMGIDNGGVGLFVNNKQTGLGIKIDQNNTITSSTAFGLQINQMSSVAPAMQVQTVSGATTAIQLFASSASAGQSFLSFVAAGEEKGAFKADTGVISWKAPIEIHDGGMFRARGLNTETNSNQVKVKNTEVQLSSYAGSTDQYWHKRISHGGQSIKIETADTLAGGVDAAPTYTTGVEVKNVSGATQIGLYGAAPVPRAAAIATPTSDTVGTKAAIDAIRAALTGIGITL
ncbi:hypothetical protein GCM10007170_15250 [Arthrobacter liuii]|uniref:Uncharacterized protein n=2 Tax=Arthrobacter liuii TaxID=1476996 RepID=A0ABQ2AQ95_9MICC|nr:hypothetical protein GCM10007170_15250 [Arthrobacter liuii]